MALHTISTAIQPQPLFSVESGPGLVEPISRASCFSTFIFLLPQTCLKETTIDKMFGKREEPTPAEVLDQHQPSHAEVNTHQKSVSKTGLTGASALTVKQSILPITLVTILFFLWGFAYGLLDVLNAKFQTALNITAAQAGGTLYLALPKTMQKSIRMIGS